LGLCSTLGSADLLFFFSGFTALGSFDSVLTSLLLLLALMLAINSLTLPLLLALASRLFFHLARLRLVPIELF
jgi:hypothetical protein